MLERTFTYNDFAVATNYTRVIGDNMVNEFNFGWRHSSEHNPWASSFDINRNRRIDSHTAFPGDDGRDNGGDGSNTQGVVPYTLAQWYPTNNLYGIIPAMSFGAPIPNPANPSWDSRFINYGNDDLFNFYNGLSWTSGRHNFKVGAYVEHLTNIEGKGASALAGRYDFNRDPANPFGTGHPYANALVGSFRSYQENTARLGQRASQWIGNFFVQDKWQPVDRLTLDIGMRFSKYTVFEQANPSASFLPSRFDHANAAQLYVPTLVNGVRMAMNPNDPTDIRPEVVIGALAPGSPSDNGMVRHNDSQVPAPFQDLPTILLEPRIGFAYDLFGNGPDGAAGQLRRVPQHAAGRRAQLAAGAQSAARGDAAGLVQHDVQLGDDPAGGARGHRRHRLSDRHGVRRGDRSSGADALQLHGPACRPRSAGRRCSTSPTSGRGAATSRSSGTRTPSSAAPGSCRRTRTRPPAVRCPTTSSAPTPATPASS